jgi:hypothetical protein
VLACGAALKQAVIIPDCPRCHGPLWFFPCPHAGGCSGEHYECPTCKVEWVRHPAFDPQWMRFGPGGEVLETIPPRVPGFRGLAVRSGEDGDKRRHTGKKKRQEPREKH